MEQNKKAFGLHLNLFDGIVILVALVVGGILLWSQLKPAAPADDPDAQPIRYTIRMLKTVPGMGDQVKVGDTVLDSSKGFEMGTVVSAETVPSYDLTVDNESQSYVEVPVPGKEDVYVVVDSTAVITEKSITLTGGSIIRVGETMYFRGPGYMCTGRIHAIERGE